MRLVVQLNIRWILKKYKYICTDWRLPTNKIVNEIGPRKGYLLYSLLNVAVVSWGSTSSLAKKFYHLLKFLFHQSNVIWRQKSLVLFEEDIFHFWIKMCNVKEFNFDDSNFSWTRIVSLVVSSFSNFLMPS